jgi:lipopolysaccharide transport system permease protein
MAVFFDRVEQRASNPRVSVQRCGPVATPEDWSRSVITPPGTWELIDFREMWRFRELLYFLTWRDAKVRYKQTLLGLTWVLFQPLFTMAVFCVVFGRLPGFGQNAGKVPYPLFVYAGLLPWNFFASGFAAAANSVIANQNLVTKVYFPRLLLPLAAVAVRLLDLVIGFVVLVGMMVLFGLRPGPAVFLAPLPVLIVGLAAAGAGSLFAALTVRYRDFLHLVPFLTQTLMFLTPVIYPADFIPGRWRWLLALNPVADLVEAFRDVVVGQAGGLPTEVFRSAGLTVVLFVLGVYCFRRMERQFADLI